MNVRASPVRILVIAVVLTAGVAAGIAFAQANREFAADTVVSPTSIASGVRLSATPEASASAKTDPIHGMRWMTAKWPGSPMADGPGAARFIHYDDVTAQWIAFNDYEVWTSPDGLVWSLGELEWICPPVAFCTGWQVNAVLRSGDSLIAVRKTAEREITLRAWSSTDGKKWSVLATTQQRSSERSSAGHQFVLVQPFDDEDATAAYASDDGVHWENARIAGMRLSAVQDYQGAYIAAGSTDSPSGQRHPVVAMSTDGLHWNRVGVRGGGSIESLTRLPSGRFVAIGIDGAGAVTAWTATDPQGSWDATSLTGPGEVRELYVPTVFLARAVNGVVAAANTSADGPLVWTSADGVEWLKAEPPTEDPDRGFTAVASGPKVVTFGATRRQGYAPFPANSPFSIWVGATTSGRSAAEE